MYFSGQTERTTTIEDTFDSAANWNSVWGANDIAEVDGNHRLDVTGESSPASSEASLMALSSEDAEQALNAAYQSSGNYLSYDTQVKVGFDDPDRLEEDTYYFAAGLSFRLNVDTEADVYNSYGVSIMRGNPNDTEDDGINDNLVPEDIENKRAIVLWRQTNNGADSAWMAYKIIEDENWPVQNATLLVRIKEAVVLRFNEGGDIPIQKGNVVVGNRSGARGRVIQGPILSNGSTWTSGATGYLLLNNNSGDFESGEELRVVGRGVLASVDSYSGDRVNIIRVYFGRSENCESEEDGGTDTPRDSTMICYPLETSPLVWPPDLDNDGAMSWPADEDYFQLVQWDVFHGVSPLVSDRELERNAIIIHHDENLQTDSDGNLGDRSEIGLHAFGNGTENIYFDDFGLQLTSQVSAVIPTPIQQ